jgi:sodium/potassium-transporting ATPase subunit alpha
MASKGQRVIACATLQLSESEFPKGHVFTAETCPSENLVFLGLVAIKDPPKPGMSCIMLCTVAHSIVETLLQGSV